MAIRFGKFELIVELPGTAAVEIWLARTPRPDLPWAIVERLQRSQEDSKTVERFLEEARVQARLHHPSIVEVYELGQVEGRYFRVLELVRGLPFEKIVHAPIEIRAALATQLGTALAYAHQLKLPDGTSLGIAHGRLDAENIAVDFDGRVKLTGFSYAFTHPLSVHPERSVAKSKGESIEACPSTGSGRTGCGSVNCYGFSESQLGSAKDRETIEQMVGKVAIEDGDSVDAVKVFVQKHFATEAIEVNEALERAEVGALQAAGAAKLLPLRFSQSSESSVVAPVAAVPGPKPTSVPPLYYVAAMVGLSGGALLLWFFLRLLGR